MIRKDRRINWSSVIAYGVITALLILELYIIFAIGGWLLGL